MAILIPYNSDDVTDAQTLAGAGPGDAVVSYRLPTVSVIAGAALRLNSGGIEFGDPPPLRDMPDVAAQLAFLNRHFHHQCGVWAKYARRFVDRYFAFVATEISENREALADRLRPFGTLYEPEHWAFSALRPLPRAHLPTGEGRAGPNGPPALTRVEIAFWTAGGPVAIELVGRGSRLPSDARRRACLEAGGVEIVEVSHDTLDSDRPDAFGALLPASFRRFWEDEALPMGPFRTCSAIGSARVRMPA